MNTRTATLIVLVTAGILAAGFLIVIGVGRGLQALQRSAASEAARQEFVARWRPPAAPTPDRLFPARVQGRTNSPPETHPSLTEPALQLPVLRSVYEADGLTSIEVYACPAQPREAEAVRQRTREVFAGRSGSTSMAQVNNRLRLSSSQPPQFVEIWEMPGWLFFFRSPAELPTDFIRDYLAAVAAPPRP